ncbi:F-box domain protein [Kalmanozyma brasiliensis GHG001]|uniref:F-box domain-containing protein n=1 Tax=Kalmanozyma brasiliensis (strain GHG001) TaxID=1365824 RepID=V5EZS5_KALBG|nr:F-box domain protein [Kalmanozyma brasiliensis GHG001]EST09448.1 F-box domain protein [Kalmanozyma brasiliensis GHG001]
MASTQPAIKVEDDQPIVFSYTARPSQPVTTLPQAWRDNNLELVVKLASEIIEMVAGAPAHGNVDAVRQLSAGLRYRFLAYEAMGLAVLAVADAKRIFELTARFGSDADVEVDDQLLPVLAGSDISAMDAEMTRDENPAMDIDTNSAPSGLKRSAEDTLGGTVVKRSKAGNRPLLRCTAGLTSLPSEVIITVADFLPASDRIKLANTCNAWRNGIPELWSSLEFVRIKNISSSQGWLRDTLETCISAIQTCQRRSHNRLSSVVLKGFVTQDGVSSILDALASSKVTLKYLAIPTPAQQHCFKQLYRHCRNLAGVDIRVQTEHRESVSTGSSLFDSTKLPFKLKTFISTQAIDCGDIARHMAGLEVVHGVKFSRQKQLSFIQGLVDAAPSLIEWQDDPEDKWDNTNVVLGDYGAGQNQLPTQPILFPKLRKLSALWAEHFIECLFPALEEARFNAQRGPNSLSPGAQNQSRIAAVVLKSPSLRKLDILMPSTTASSETRQIFNAIATLPKLKELGLWSVSSNMTLLPLVDAHKVGADNNTCLILPELHTIRLCTTTVSSTSLDRELSELLLLRFYLKQGCSLGEAKIRSEAALLVHFSSTSYGYGMTKAQRKKAINASAAEAAESTTYKGTFTTTSDGLKREEFDKSVLQNLVVSRGMSKHLVESSNALLKQLIGRIVEVDTSKKFGSHSGQHGYRGAYY